MSRRTAASPRARRGRRRGVGWTGSTGIVPNGGAAGAGRRGRGRQFQAIPAQSLAPGGRGGRGGPDGGVHVLRGGLSRRLFEGDGGGGHGVQGVELGLGFRGSKEGERRGREQGCAPLIQHGRERGGRQRARQLSHGDMAPGNSLWRQGRGRTDRGAPLSDF